MRNILVLSISLFIGSINAQPIPSYIPTDGLVAWYPFNGNANDESGNGNNAENVDNSIRPYPRFSEDRNGVTSSSYEFNGGHLSLPNFDYNLGDAGTSTTINLYFKGNMDGFTHDGILIHSTPQANDNTIFGRVGILNGGIKIYHRNSNQNYEPYFDLNLDSNWHMLTYVINSEKEIGSVYLDGSLLDGSYSYANEDYNDGDRFWELGNVSWKTNHNYKGWIDDVAIWNRALTEEEIRNIYSGGFYIHENGVTIVCDNAEIGETGVINSITYTKRTKDQITLENASTTCTSGITDMSTLFQNANEFNGDIKHWDVSTVETFENMFTNAYGFDHNLSAWDVSNAKSLNSMFYLATSFNGDISTWNTANVTDFSWMFYEADAFNGDISDWNTSNATTMKNMFRGSIFNNQIGDWNVSNVTTMEGMFQESLFDQNISNWNVSMVNNMRGMFLNSQFNQSIGLWDVSSVTDMEMMFTQSIFNNPIDNWDVSKVTNMFGMFSWYSKFNQDISSWDVSSVQVMDEMFRNADFDKDISSWCVTNIANEPSLIFENNSIPEAHKPIWGTCPEIQGTDEIPLYIPTDGLVAWYPFNGNANDESGNGNNGTVNGAILTTNKDGSENSAYLFDGVDDFISTDLILPTLNAARTVSFWFKGSIGDILSSGGGGCFEGFNLTLAENDFYVEVACGLNSYPLEGIELIEWNQVFVVVKPNSSKLSDVKVYLNGVELAPQSSDEVELNTGNEPLNIGSHFSEAYNFFNGSIDDVAIWNRALTEEEIQAVYNQGAVEPPINAIHAYVPNQNVFSIDTTYTSVYLEDVPAEGFNAFQYTLNYDPDSLNIELLDNMGTLSEGFDLGINTVNPGQIIVAGSRIDPVTENGKLSNLKISYKTGGVSHITLDDVMFNEGVPAATTGDARIESTLLVCGDVTGDNSVSALDASHILRHTVRLAPQYPLEGRDFIAGDVTSNGAVTAYDAYFVLREIVGLSAGLSCSSTIYNLKEAWAPKLDWSIITKGASIVTPLHFTDDTPEVYALEIEVPHGLEVSLNGIPEDWNTLEYTNEGSQYLSMYGLSPLTSPELVWNKITGGMMEAKLRINESQWQTIEHELEVNQILPQQYILSQNYPNPFNPSTQIQYALPEATQVTLEVFNSVGQKVVELVNGQQSAGYHVATFDASGLSSGVYLYKLTTPSFTETKKMLLIK